MENIYWKIRKLHFGKQISIVENGLVHMLSNTNQTCPNNVIDVHAQGTKERRHPGCVRFVVESERKEKKM